MEGSSPLLTQAGAEIRLRSFGGDSVLMIRPEA